MNKIEINLENFIKAIKKQSYYIRDCSICEYAMTYEYVFNQFCYDSGCYCTRRYPNYIALSESTLERLLDPINEQLEKVTEFINKVLGESNHD